MGVKRITIIFMVCFFAFGAIFGIVACEKSGKAFIEAKAASQDEISSDEISMNITMPTILSMGLSIYPTQAIEIRLNITEQTIRYRLYTLPLATQNLSNMVYSNWTYITYQDNDLEITTLSIIYTTSNSATGGTVTVGGRLSVNFAVYINNVINRNQQINYVATSVNNNALSVITVGPDNITTNIYQTLIPITIYFDTINNIAIANNGVTIDGRYNSIVPVSKGENINDTINNAYNQGYNEGYNSGIGTAQEAARQQGFNEGVASAGNYTFTGLLNAVFYAPLKAMTGMLNFEILGVNVLAIVTFLLTMAVVIGIMRLIL